MYRPYCATIDNELSAVDRGSTVGSKVGDLFKLGAAPDREPAQSIEHGLAHAFDCAAIGSPKNFEKVASYLGHDPAGRNAVDTHALWTEHAPKWSEFD